MCVCVSVCWGVVHFGCESKGKPGAWFTETKPLMRKCSIKSVNEPQQTGCPGSWLDGCVTYLWCESLISQWLNIFHAGLLNQMLLQFWFPDVSEQASVWLAATGWNSTHCRSVPLKCSSHIWRNSFPCGSYHSSIQQWGEARCLKISRTIAFRFKLPWPGSSLVFRLFYFSESEHFSAATPNPRGTNMALVRTFPGTS